MFVQAALFLTYFFTGISYIIFVGEAIYQASADVRRLPGRPRADIVAKACSGLAGLALPRAAPRPIHAVMPAHVSL